MTIKAIITDDQPPITGGKGVTDPKHDVVRQLVDDLQPNGRWGKLEGYSERREAELGKRCAEKHAEKYGCRATTRIRKEDDGTWSLWIRTYPAKA